MFSHMFLLFKSLLLAQTTGYLLGFPATLFLGTVLRALRDLMHGVEDLFVPGLRAMSQNILWSTTRDWTSRGGFGTQIKTRRSYSSYL